jgi:hypothetical protein
MEGSASTTIYKPSRFDCAISNVKLFGSYVEISISEGVMGIFESQFKSNRTNRLVHIYSYVVGGVQSIYWLYTFRFLYLNTNWMGDGFEWVAVMPIGLIFFCFVVPGLKMNRDGKSLKLAATLVTIGLFLNIALFYEISGELAGEASKVLNF